jgi:hypothetical protein
MSPQPWRFPSKGAVMNKLDSLQGAGALYLDDNLIGKAKYEILINRDGDGQALAFGWMLVSRPVIDLINVSVGGYRLELQQGGKVELVLAEITETTINFDVSGRVPGF